MSASVAVVVAAPGGAGAATSGAGSGAIRVGRGAGARVACAAGSTMTGAAGLSGLDARAATEPSAEANASVTPTTMPIATAAIAKRFSSCAADRHQPLAPPTNELRRYGEMSNSSVGGPNGLGPIAGRSRSRRSLGGAIRGRATGSPTRVATSDWIQRSRLGRSGAAGALALSACGATLGVGMGGGRRRRGIAGIAAVGIGGGVEARAALALDAGFSGGGGGVAARAALARAFFFGNRAAGGTLGVLAFEDWAFEEGAFEDLGFEDWAFEDWAFEDWAFEDWAFEDWAFEERAFEDWGFETSALDDFARALRRRFRRGGRLAAGGGRLTGGAAICSVSPSGSNELGRRRTPLADCFGGRGFGTRGNADISPRGQRKTRSSPRG